MTTRKNLYEAKRTLPLTNKEAEAVFGVTQMTLHLWRQGTPTKSVLRTIKGRGREVRYGVASTLEWARKNEVPIVVHPDDLGKPRQDALAAKKPGPKPRAAAVAQALASERPLARRPRDHKPAA